MNILGISAFYHDSAACLINNDEIIAAAQEERFTRVKHDSSYPENAVKYCLAHAGISGKEIDYVAFYDKPFLKFERLLETYLAFAPKGVSSFVTAMPIWIKKKIWIKEVIKKNLPGFDGEIIFPEHHESHAASAFFASPFEEAAWLTVDGVGEWATTSFGIGENNKINIMGELKFPHSLGLLYSAFTYFTGFKVNSGEYKMMGLAPYGEPKYKQLILNELIDIKEDGSFRLNLNYFNYCVGLKMVNKKFAKLFGGPARKPESKITQREMDIASSIQAVTEDILLKIAKNVYQKTGKKFLCLAGGVALNCTANGRLLKESPFKDIWIQPASGDAGGALGAALATYYQYLNNRRISDNINDKQKGSYLGPEYSNGDILKYLRENNIVFSELQHSDLPSSIADLIAQEKVIGWFQGRMEFGPRALGARSILGDARSEKMQKKLNLKIKFRESFRPFAPSVLLEDVADYFEIDRPSPYMLLVAKVKGDKLRKNSSPNYLLTGVEKVNEIRSVIPAVTHVDFSARIQTVDGKRNILYYDLIRSFKEKYNCPVIINTSFNVRGEPIVCTPHDAYSCFMRTDMDYLVIGDYLIDKNKQKNFKEELNWRKMYKLD
jgi:carbamoyltransferase